MTTAWSAASPPVPTKRTSKEPCGPNGSTTTSASQGQDQLQIFIQAARERSEALDHVLLFGPPGLGKTTLAHILAKELGVNLRQTSGPVLERAGDLAALLTNLERNDVLFIDEIHRLSPVVEEILYPALEDYQIDIMICEGQLPQHQTGSAAFTPGRRTTRAGMLTNPLRDRFGSFLDWSFMRPKTCSHSAALSWFLKVALSEDGAAKLPSAPCTPRIANRLLRRVRDYAQVKQAAVINAQIADAALACSSRQPGL